MYVPLSQYLQELSDPMYCPDEHVLQADAPAADDDPSGHIKGSRIPKFGAYVPAKLFWH